MGAKINQCHIQKSATSGAFQLPINLIWFENFFTENVIDPVRNGTRDRDGAISLKTRWYPLLPPANLKLQIDQLILGASQRSTQDSAGSHCRLRFNFISRYHKGLQGYPVKEKSFNVLCNLL